MNRELLQQALDALEFPHDSEWSNKAKAIAALEAELAKQEPKLTDAGADTNIARGLEPKGSGMVTLNQPEQEPVAKHVCNLWINPETSEYEVDRCTHPISEVIPVYTASTRKDWVGLTEHEIWECQKPGLSDDVYKLIEAKLKEKNT